LKTVIGFGIKKSQPHK